MTEEAKAYAPGRSIFAGGCLGTLLGTAASLVFFTLAFLNTPALSTGLFESLVRALAASPGLLLIAAILAFPTAGIMVMVIVPLARRWRMFDRIGTWLVGGVTASIPVAWGFERFNASSSATVDFSWLSGSIFLIGAVSSLAAWRARRPNAASLET